MTLSKDNKDNHPHMAFIVKYEFPFSFCLIMEGRGEKKVETNRMAGMFVVKFVIESLALTGVFEDQVSTGRPRAAEICFDVFSNKGA
jgi:hypothetical protein